jgi:hypothetical protein
MLISQQNSSILSPAANFVATLKPSIAVTISQINGPKQITKVTTNQQVNQYIICVTIRIIK